MANKIVYGLSNVHVFPITATSATGVPTYGTAIAVPGAVSCSFSAQGSSDPFYADNTVYYQGVSNTGYEGDLEIADIPEAFLTDIMGEIEGKNGTLFENSDVEVKEFAMAFEFNGDAAKRRHLFYRCKATRPDIASKTKEENIEPNTNTLSVTMMPRLDNKMVKARCEEGDADYAAWYTQPVEYEAKQG